MVPLINTPNMVPITFPIPPVNNVPPLPPMQWSLVPSLVQTVHKPASNEILHTNPARAEQKAAEGIYGDLCARHW